ncbi:MAG TPA: nucleoside triphosphate pyrophosphohydrolase family protein [Lacisediminihabitans sp.]|nr:nucleoside triphosphate pyrophosphohydrolase family protein [Lacisediminihabitans sp.]HXD60923.1 nucleoside triphosphate pyrophosphohydrolase family protein [Lacisediminihabitans sp.]
MTDDVANPDETIQLRQMVLEFYERHNLPVRNAPGLVQDPREEQQMLELLREEVGELTSAIERGDLLKIIDGLADVVYVAYGMSLQYGIDLDVALSRVHSSNMTKIDLDGPWSTGRPRKVARGEEYSPPEFGDLFSE